MNGHKSTIQWPFPSPPLRRGIVADVPWAIARSMGTLYVCGYAQVPADHPWATAQEVYDLPLDAAGGLTFGPTTTGRLPLTMADVCRWVGFDTAHLGDYWPDSELAALGIPLDDVPEAAYLMRAMNADRPWTHVWTAARMITETVNLAWQIADARQDY